MGVPVCIVDQKWISPAWQPETKSSGWMGCHEMQDTSRRWPLKAATSRMARMSKSLISWSLDAESKWPPPGCQRTLLTGPLCWCSVAASRGARGSHNLVDPSLDAEASRALVGCHSQCLTSHRCDLPTSRPAPGISLTRAPRSKSQTLTAPSSEPVQKKVSVGQKEMARTAPPCACTSLTLFNVTCQYLTRPPPSPDSSHSPPRDQQRACSGSSCACWFASKLKEKPDQRVNMPLKLAVMRRRPSGNQAPALTDERSLLSAECTNRVHAEPAAFERVPDGGSISTAASADASSVYGASITSGQSVRSFSSRTAHDAKSTVLRQ
eukprot:scaffold18902_cov119-Isochrysis_galbana.AAC.4